ncbi:PREDICTED: disease resistance protein RGA2 [Theobroma cacao]|uniref:Disease resistance protein RGA2 n=1 Tax=Theobroma cacao TaxID=3641 RepID=A0AB32WCV5_THECC|nr:PREDICTED: disease resistance protein RGA2 [Theobroma cacao]
MVGLFLFNIAERVLEKIALLAGEVLLAFSVKSDLRKLQDTMSSIKAVLLDAERQQHQNEKLRLCMWKLRDIFYDVEDVLDEFECEALRKQIANHPCISVKRLDKIAADWGRFDLGVTGDNRRVIHRETHSFVNSSDVIGRDVDKKNILDLLMRPSEGRNIPVITVVGIGGPGRTTLAQFVYNDERVIKHFPLRIWVSVSEEFDLARLLKEIIYSINSERCDGLTFNAMQTRLRSLLSDKKFLLVLDDVWNENRQKWIELRTLLMSLDNPSQNKIIVTTRSLKVASMMSSIHPYQLKVLPHKECLTLFITWTFNDGDERRYPNVIRI